MDVMTENKLVPELSFAEFENERNTNSYKKYSFTDIFLFSSGKNIKQAEASPEFETPCVRYGELYHMYNEVIYKIINRTNLAKSELLFSQGNEILLPSAGEDPLDIGSASALTLKDVAIGRTINVLSPKSDNVYSQKYASYYINQKLRKQISKMARGVSISNVYNSDLKKLKIILPSLKEQQKIASFLSSVDKKLQQLAKKKELLSAYKKGVMQKIFSQELRFKDEFGNNYPDWEEKKLGEVCDVTVGGTPSTTKKEYWNGDIGWISSGAMNNGNVTQPSKLITKLGLDSSSAKMMPENTVMLAMTGATLGKVGYLKFNSSANQSVAGFLPNETYNSKYLFYTLKQGINQVFKYSGGAAQQGINKQSILNLKYKFPSLEEQQKIANFLTSLDIKIELVSTQIENTKAFKKGLLQQMFV